jgi:hypothetical protein
MIGTELVFSEKIEFQLWCTFSPRGYVVGGSETGDVADTTQVETDFAMNAIIRWGGSRQSVFTKKKDILYEKLAKSKNCDKVVTI